MKNLYSCYKWLTLPLLLCLSLFVNAQCPVGYTQAQVNWDKLDYYFNSGGGVRPYGTSSGGTYVTDAMEMSQKFAIGPNYVTIATNNNGVINPVSANGVTVENTTHTGDLPGYTGADVQYNPAAIGDKITFTFNTEVQNLNFTLYDVDALQSLTLNAKDASGTGTNMSVTLQAGTNIVLAGNNTPTATITANATAAANNVNTNSATISVTGPIKTFTITVAVVGTDAIFWLSDINACVSGTFPTDYNKTPSNQPFTGPTQNQADYFIITPDNDSAFMVNPANGQAWFLFSDPANTYMNSFAYDPYNHLLYYISEGVSLNSANKSIKKYNFNTNTISTVIADITTLNIPTFNSGVESAAAAYYNDNLFIGFEGGQFDGNNTRESIIYRIDFDASGNPTNAVQVFGTNSYNGGSAIHDWADMIIKNGVLYNYNSRPGTTMIAFEHYDMMTGQSTTYTNPNAATGYSFQAGMTWTGTLYSFQSGALNKYFENGTLGPNIPITSMSGTTWKTGSGDGSENFKPKCDFGDAPATYDPVAISPAVHERTDSIRLGATWDNEFSKRGVTGNNDVDDGLAYTPILTPGAHYYPQVTVYNHSGSPATLIGWLDINGNGVFEASEACTPIAVPSSTSNQSFYLIWYNVYTPLVPGQFTYLRIRITSASAGMTTSDATGFFFNGEVEDYKVIVDNFPLAVNLVNFDASVINNKTVKLDWNANEDDNFNGYELERSSNSTNWSHLAFVSGNGHAGTYSYAYNDNQPLKGTSYYRLKLPGSNGGFKYSDVRSVRIRSFAESITIVPNPANNKCIVSLEADRSGDIDIYLLNVSGKLLYYEKHRIAIGSNSIDIPVQRFPAGAYVMQVKTPDGELINRKIIINR
jgi:hypothetical protein